MDFSSSLVTLSVVSGVTFNDGAGRYKDPVMNRLRGLGAGSPIGGRAGGRGKLYGMLLPQKEPRAGDGEEAEEMSRRNGR